jgi:hypothetical protein
MKEQFVDKALASTYLWAENKVLNQEAYTNYTSKLYYQPDQSIQDYYSYAAPFRQWVYDSGVNGANVIQSVSTNIGVLDRSSGIMFDYNNGRALIPTGYGSGLNVTGSYAFKEINIYTTNETQEEILTQDKYFLNPRYHSSPTGAPPAYAITTPAIFVSVLNTENEPFALGGVDMCNYNMSLTILAETPYQLNSLFGIFADAKHNYIPILNLADDPINEWGDLKSGNFNYLDLRDQKGGPGNLIYIKDVQTSQVNSKTPVNQALYRGIVDMDIQFPRITNDRAENPNYLIGTGFQDSYFYLTTS